MSLGGGVTGVARGVAVETGGERGARGAEVQRRDGAIAFGVIGGVLGTRRRLVRLGLGLGRARGLDGGGVDGGGARDLARGERGVGERREIRRSRDDAASFGAVGSGGGRVRGFGRRRPPGGAGRGAARGGLGARAVTRARPRLARLEALVRPLHRLEPRDVPALVGVKRPRERSVRAASLRGGRGRADAEDRARLLARHRDARWGEGRGSAVASGHRGRERRARGGCDVASECRRQDRGAGVGKKRFASQPARR